MLGYTIYLLFLQIQDNNAEAKQRVKAVKHSPSVLVVADFFFFPLEMLCCFQAKIAGKNQQNNNRCRSTNILVPGLDKYGVQDSAFLMLIYSCLKTGLAEDKHFFLQVKADSD